MACCDNPECKDTWTDERRWREQVINLLTCLLTTNVAKDTEIMSLCDVQEDYSVISFIRIITVNCDGSKTVEDFELDGVTPYTVTGEVDNCDLVTPATLCLPPSADFPLAPEINCVVNIVNYTGVGGPYPDGLYYWNGASWVPLVLD